MADAPPPVPTYQPTLYGADGHPLDLSGDDAAKAIAAGKAGFLKGQQVHVVQRDGSVGTIKAEDAPKALQQGMRLATDAEVHHAKVEAKYGGVGGQIMTGALGAASGLSLGATDVLANALGAGQYVREHAEANPGTFTAGQVVGAVAPAFLGDEAGLAGVAKEGAEATDLARAGEEATDAGQALGEAKPLAGETPFRTPQAPPPAPHPAPIPAPPTALGTAKRALNTLAAPQRAVSAVGSGIEDVVRGVLGADGEGSLVTGLAKKALAKGAGVAAEGALVGGAQQLDENVLSGDPEINGEKLMAAMGYGSLLGLGGAGALTALGELGSRVLGRAAPTLSGMAEEQAVRSATSVSNRGVMKELDRLPGGIRAAGRRMLDDGVVQMGDEAGGEEIAARLAERKQAAGERVNEIRATADAADIEKPRVQAIRDRIQSEVLDDLQKMPKLNRAAIDRVQSALDDLDSRVGITGGDEEAMAVQREHAQIGLQDLAKLRGEYGSQVNWKPIGLSAPENSANEAMKKVVGIMENELETAGDRAADKLGGSFLKDYKDAKLAFRQYNVLERLASDSVSALHTNRVISPSDYMTGVAAAATHHGGRMLAGGLAGAALGEEEGGTEGMLGGLATGAIGALAHHALRTRGNAAAAVILDKLSALRGIERASRHVDNQIERGVAGFFKEEGRIPVKLREPIEGEKGDHPAVTAVKKVARAVANDNAHADDIRRAAAPIEPHAPQTANSFQRAALRATMFLSDRMPKTATRPSITPQFDKPALSDAQKADYHRLVTAVHDPASVLDDMAKGRVTRAQVDALRMVYPSLYAEVVERVHERLADLKHPLSYQQKLSLSLLLGVPADETLSPAFVQAMQASYGQGGGAPAGGKGAPKRMQRPLKGDLSHDVELAMGQGPHER